MARKNEAPLIVATVALVPHLPSYVVTAVVVTRDVVVSCVVQVTRDVVVTSCVVLEHVLVKNVVRRADEGQVEQALHSNRSHVLVGLLLGAGHTHWLTSMDEWLQL